jgi:hypothetical protein
VKRLACLVFLLPLGCWERNSANLQLADFTSDGCSLFLNGTFEDPDMWEDCCHKHDLAYWRGCTEEERYQADLAFKACVLKKTGNAELAEIMYQAVRVGGSPYFPTWYRWGYGWPVGRGYQKLSEADLLLVDQKLAKYKNSIEGKSFRSSVQPSKLE